MRCLQAWVQRSFWEVTDECWAAIETRLRPGIRTLETGSGRSTGLFEGAGCDHVALEHDPQRRAPFASVIIAPLVGTPPWYAWDPPHAFDLVFIDGPPGRIGRAGVLRVLPRLITSESWVVVDDTQRRAERRLARQVAVQHDLAIEWRITFKMGLPRGFAVLHPREEGHPLRPGARGHR